MTRVLASLLLVGCAADEVPATRPCAEPDAAPHPRAAEYEALLDAFVADNVMPGAIVGVRRGDEPPWIGAAGSANLTHANPMQTCTPFRTGSITKMIVGARLLQLVDEGLVGLDDPVADHVPPEVAARVPASDRMTIRQLLNHSSGLRHPSDEDVGYGLALVDDPERSAGTPYREKLEREVYGRSLLFEPGTDSHYSNAGYWLLGLVIERRGGAPLARDLDAALFAPNGLSSTRLADGPDDTVARGYTRMDGGIVDSTAWDRGDSDGDPAGGVVSTAADLLAFGELLFDGALVSEESLAAMLETTRFPSCGGDCELGLGLESLHAYPEVGYGKNGSLPGVDANLFVFPESDTALVVFANYGSGNLKDVFADLFADGG